MDFSVIIPTYNRSRTLQTTLEALVAQEPPACSPFSYEVIVVDDGSTDDTEQRVSSFQNQMAASGDQGYGANIRYLRQQNRKQGAARNLGAKEARGDFLVFLGDDTIPAPDFLTRHAMARQERGNWVPDSRLVVIGYTRWAKHLPVTRFMQYVGEQGWQFGFALITDRENVPFNFFYTSNLSIGRRFFLESGGFDETFQEYGWEDIELSLRLKRQGMRLVYEPGALAWHDHPTSLKSFIKRQRKVGCTAWRFYRLHPEMADFLSVLKIRPYTVRRRFQMSLLTILCSVTEKRRWPDLSRYYPDLMSYHYSLGVLRARQEDESRHSGGDKRRR